LKTSINLTGRIDIPRENIAAQVSLENGIQYLAAEWDLSTFEIPEDSDMTLDVWALGTYETRRVILGKVGTGTGKVLDVDISDMRNAERLKARLIVKRFDGELPMIIAQLDQISVVRLGDAEDENSILLIESDKELSSTWELQIFEGEPVLKIKEKNGMHAYLKSESPMFEPLVLPEVLGKVFDWFVLPDELKSPEAAEKWKAFFIGLGCDEEIFEMVDNGALDVEEEQILAARRDVQAKFVAKHGLFKAIEIQMDSTRGVE